MLTCAGASSEAIDMQLWPATASGSAQATQNGGLHFVTAVSQTAPLEYTSGVAGAQSD